MDQFATGLVGTRTPYGAVRDSRRPAYVSGGSSAGSAVAVALGMADLALGTDTAGSGRVPAAFGGIVGLKPTRGLVPNVGVVPACRTLDCVTVFASRLAEAEEAMAVMAAIAAAPVAEPADPRARAWPPDAPLAAPPSPLVAVPRELPELDEAEVGAFRAACARMSEAGARLVEIDLDPFLEAAQLLYGGGFAAERYQGVGDFVNHHADDVDPVVGSIIQAAARIPAHALVEDGKRLDELRLEAMATLEGCDALFVPTAPFQPTLEAVAADPVGVNSRLGTYTNFCNLFDLCAASVPAGRAGKAEFGVTVLARPFADRIACDVARLLAGGGPPVRVAGPPATELLVLGAHLAGQPLNHQLTERGARLLGVVRTAPEYRLYALDTEPPKPGLVRVTDGGAGVEGELWALPPAALGALLAGLPAPMTLGRVRLDDGRAVTGFLCEGIATEGALDITTSGGWVAYLQEA
jgi:allophanate hydrolase